MSLKSKVESLIFAGNETTGQSKTDLTSVVQDLVDGYGQGGGGVTVESLSVTQNGTYTAPSGKAYSPISVSVPNSYSASDDGKVVDNGALVAQTSATYTENGTYDTTLIDDVTVNVSGGGGFTVDDYLAKEFTGSGEYTGTSVQGICLRGQTGITSISLPNVTTLKDAIQYKFGGMTGLTYFSAPKATNVADYCLAGNTSLSVLDMPKLVDTGHSFAKGCTSLVSGVFPAMHTVYISAFENCSNLESLDILGKNSTANRGFVNGNACKGCTKLKVLVIRNANYVSALSSLNNFDNTPFASGGTGGTLYVPESKLSAYQSATNWSTILGYANNQIKSIESTHTDPDAPIDLTTHYADGSLIDEY